MVAIKPVGLRLVRPEWVDEVPAPPEDALSPDARRRHLADHPRSYLSVTRSPNDLLESEMPSADDGPPDLLAHSLQLSRASLEGLLAEGIFGPEEPPALYLYQLEAGGHRQTGLVCGVPTADYDIGRIRVHERYNRDRADLLARHLATVGAQSNPIVMGFESSERFGAVADRVAKDPPRLEVAGPSLRQRLWAITDQADVESMVGSLADLPFYLIDGHHRAAAASAHRATAADSDHLMLAALFPVDQLRNLAFHRILHPVDPHQLLSWLEQQTSLRRASTPREVVSRSDDEIALAVGQSDGAPQWWLVTLPRPVAGRDHWLDIDPVRLARHVLRPALDIDEATSDPRLSYRPGADDEAAVTQLRLDDGQVACWMRPVPMQTLLEVSDRGETMPPKSTYFQPKAQAGLFLRSVDPTLR